MTALHEAAVNERTRLHAPTIRWICDWLDEWATGPAPGFEQRLQAFEHASRSFRRIAADVDAGNDLADPV